MNRSIRQTAASLVLVVLVAACAPAGPPAPTGPGSEQAADVLRAFADQTANPNRSFHLVQTGSVSVGIRTIQVTYELDAAGEDVSGVLKVDAQVVQVRVVDGRAFANAGGGWQSMPADSDLTRDVLDVFRYVGDSSNLRFVERIDEPGGPAFWFRAVNPIPYQTAQMRELGLTGSILELDFHVRGDGVPLRIDFVSKAEQGNTEVDARSHIEFSRWGEPIVIEAPL